MIDKALFPTDNAIKADEKIVFSISFDNLVNSKINITFASYKTKLDFYSNVTSFPFPGAQSPER